MGYSDDLEIDNSFAVKLRNTTNSRQTFSMFELGSDAPDRISTTLTPIAREPNNQNLFFDLLQGGTSLGMFEINDESYISICKFDITIFVPPPITSITGLVLNVGADTKTLQSITDEANEKLVANASTKYIRIQFSGFYDPALNGFNKSKLLLSITYLTENPLVAGDTIGYFKGDANDPSNNMLVQKIAFTSIINASGLSIPDQEQNDIAKYPATKTNITPNGGIELLNGDGTPYDQILESQSGGVLDIKSMRVDAISQSNILAGFQLLEPLKFFKLNADGNKKVHIKVPIIDPYQFQNSVDFIETSTKADTFSLDGTTKFSNAVQPNTSIRLSFNYTQLTNLVADSKYGDEMVRKQQANIEAEKEEGDNAGVKKLQIPKSVLSTIEQQNIDAVEVEKKKNKYLNYNHNPYYLEKKYLYCSHSY